jgi:TATA-box binding protein (TBP) (component of TFIID and TFIIIB)
MPSLSLQDAIEVIPLASLKDINQISATLKNEINLYEPEDFKAIFVLISRRITILSRELAGY